MAVRGLPPHSHARRRQLPRLVGLNHVACKRLDGHSSGVRQRVGIAQALLTDPKVQIVDEPVVWSGVKLGIAIDDCADNPIALGV